MTTEVRFDTAVDQERRAAVQRGLRATNRERSAALRDLDARGDNDEVPFDLYALDDDGELVGGLVGSTWATWLHVELLWVADEHRGAGLGARLLTEAEARARDGRGCAHVRLGTWGYQAPGFYVKQGYREVGVIEDYPPGEREHLFVKDL